MSSKFVDRTHIFQNKLVNAQRTALQKGMRKVVQLAKNDVRTPFPPASRPGEPPHKRTGLGQSSITYQTKKNRGKWEGRLVIREQGIHMLYLELGTRTIKRRPWMLSPIRRNRKLLGRIMATGGKGKLK